MPDETETTETVSDIHAPIPQFAEGDPCPTLVTVQFTGTLRMLVVGPYGDTEESEAIALAKVQQALDAQKRRIEGMTLPINEELRLPLGVDLKPTGAEATWGYYDPEAE